MNISAYTIPPEVGIFKALADLTRLRILKSLTQGEMCVCQIEHSLGISQTLASRHLSLLRMAGLVKNRRDSQWIYYSLLHPRNEFEKNILNSIKTSLKDTEISRTDTIKCRQARLKYFPKRRITLTPSRRP
jgi:ArsR family transcriptional regulator